MSTRSLYVRDVPEDVHAILRTRAAAEGMSLSAYVLRMIREETEQLTVAEVLGRRREPVELSDEDILTAIHDGRR